MNYKKEIIQICKDIIDLKIGIIEGARRLGNYQFEDNLQNNGDIMFFVGISSETDHLPIGEYRKNWNKDALKKRIKKLKNLNRTIKMRR